MPGDEEQGLIHVIERGPSLPNRPRVNSEWRASVFSPWNFRDFDWHRLLIVEQYIEVTMQGSRHHVVVVNNHPVENENL